VNDKDKPRRAVIELDGRVIAEAVLRRGEGGGPIVVRRPKGDG